MNQFLQGDLRDRIADLCHLHNVTQKDLAKHIGIDGGTFSRFMTNGTAKLGHTHVLRIARFFRVSTDFLLGEVDVPDRKQYEISELGMSVEAAHNLYRQKADPGVVSWLLESPKFHKLTRMMKVYMSGDIAKGFALQNQLLNTISDLSYGLTENQDVLGALECMKLTENPPYLMEMSNMKNQFEEVLNELREEQKYDFKVDEIMTKELTEHMFHEMTKGMDMQHPQIALHQMVNAILSVFIPLGARPEDLVGLQAELTKVLETLNRPQAENVNAGN